MGLAIRPGYRHVVNRSFLSPSMPTDFPSYILQLNDTLGAENGENLAFLLRPTSPHGKDLVKQSRNATVRPFQIRICCQLNQMLH